MARKFPNIVLTIADDQRGTALGCAGLEPVQTPALDALAARGARFAQAQHFGSCHGAVCAPSRAMLMTGVPYFQLDSSLLSATYPPKNRAIHLPPTLGEKLRSVGYDTFATGKWHNGVHSFQPSFSGGANIFFGGMADHWFTPVHDFDPSGVYPPEARRVADGFSTEVFAQSAINYIRSRRDQDEPFFCYCAFTAPHDPRTPPDAWRRRYDPSALAVPPNTTPSHFNNSPLGVKPSESDVSLDERDELLLGIPRDVKEIQRALAGYYGMISHMDEWIGRIHEAVAEIGAGEDTLIIHTADHGLAVGQHGLLGKQNLYRHSLNVPLILTGPGVPRGMTSEALCYQHDLHPTLMELAGLGSSFAPFQSLTPLLKSESTGRNYIAAAFGSVLRSVRDQRYKLIEANVKGTLTWRLFDLENDPWETRDLSSEAGSNAIAATLRNELRCWQEQVGDTGWPGVKT